MEGLNDGFIQWMRPLNRLEDFELDQREPNQSKEARFIDIFRNAWNNAGEARSDYAREQYALSVGETDDPHNLMIAANKAELSVELLVQLRNKALESYDQLIKIGF